MCSPNTNVPSSNIAKTTEAAKILFLKFTPIRLLPTRYGGTVDHRVHGQFKEDFPGQEGND
jgi:hypothetical protein